MGIIDRLLKRNNSSVGFLIGDNSYCVPGYVSLDRCPEIVAACRKIAELISATTIHLMKNTANGDERIVNELSRAIDINPIQTMTRRTWMESIVMNLLLYGSGNSVCIPHTYKGFLKSIEPISAQRVSFLPIGYRDYKIMIDGQERDPKNLLHFVYNPDKTYLWQGQGLTVSLSELARSLKQAETTKKGFLESKWKPSVIVKVDAMLEEFSGVKGREKLLAEYVESSEAGNPWLIPAEQFEIEQVKPLTLKDLAISETVELDKRMVAALLGVPPFVLGLGDFDVSAWNNFVQSTLRTIMVEIQQEMTRKLILSPDWYLRFNIWSLLEYDLKMVSDVLLSGSDRGYVCGDEWRERVNLSPAGLDEYRILENYIPWEMSGEQNKLKG